MIKGAIFDMDGTLLDSMPVWEHACEQYMLGRGIVAREGLSDILFTMSMMEGAAYVKETYGMAESEKEIAEGVNALVMDAYRLNIPAKPGVQQFLDQLRKMGIPMVVATSTDRPMAEASLMRTGLLPYFQRIFTSTEVGVGKSSPEIYHAAAKFLGACPEELLVFEDALYAAQTAVKAGYITVGVYDAVSRRQREEEQLKRIANGYVADWRDVTWEKVLPGERKTKKCIAGKQEV